MLERFLGRRNDTGIKRSELVDVLEEHADSLMHGTDNADELLEQHPEANDPALDRLFALGRGTYRILSSTTHVEPSSDFVTGLKTKLMEEKLYHDASAERWEGRKAWASDQNGALGTLVSLLALLALVVHIVGTVVLVVAFIIGIGRSRKEIVTPTAS